MSSINNVSSSGGETENYWKELRYIRFKSLLDNVQLLRMSDARWYCIPELALTWNELPLKVSKRYLGTERICCAVDPIPTSL